MLFPALNMVESKRTLKRLERFHFMLENLQRHIHELQRISVVADDRMRKPKAPTKRTVSKKR